jgi:hypothetical protein
MTPAQQAEAVAEWAAEDESAAAAADQRARMGLARVFYDRIGTTYTTTDKKTGAKVKREYKGCVSVDPYGRGRWNNPISGYVGHICRALCQLPGIISEVARAPRDFGDGSGGSLDSADKVADVFQDLECAIDALSDLDLGALARMAVANLQNGRAI